MISKFAPHETKKKLFSVVLKMLSCDLENLTKQKQNAAPGDYAECSIFKDLR